jgi:hypothetical protein
MPALSTTNTLCVSGATTQHNRTILQATVAPETSTTATATATTTATTNQSTDRGELYNLRELTTIWDEDSIMRELQSHNDRSSNHDNDNNNDNDKPITIGTTQCVTQHDFASDSQWARSPSDSMHPAAIIDWNCSAAAWNAARIIGMAHIATGTRSEQRNSIALARIGRHVVGFNINAALESVVFRNLCSTYRFDSTPLAEPIVLDRTLIADSELYGMLVDLSDSTREVLQLNGFEVSVERQQSEHPRLVGLCTTLDDGLQVQDLIELLEAIRESQLVANGWCMDGAAADPLGVRTLPIPRSPTLVSWLADKAASVVAAQLNTGGSGGLGIGSPSGRISKRQAQRILDQFLALEQRRPHAYNQQYQRVFACPHSKHVLYELRELVHTTDC